MKAIILHSYLNFPPFLYFPSVRILMENNRCMPNIDSNFSDIWVIKLMKKTLQAITEDESVTSF